MRIYTLTRVVTTLAFISGYPRSGRYVISTALPHVRTCAVSYRVPVRCYIIPIINNDFINNKKRRFEDATADILRRINADHGEDEIVPEDEDSNSSSESDMEIV